MKLAKLEITDFRCFEKLRIEFPQDLAVLVGNNGAGKTAILEGIALRPNLALLPSHWRRLGWGRDSKSFARLKRCI